MKRILIVMLFVVGLTIETTLMADETITVATMTDVSLWIKAHPAKSYPGAYGTLITFQLKDGKTLVKAKKVKWVDGAAWFF